MIVYIVALSELLAYLAAVPLSAAFRVEGTRARAALRVFGLPVRVRIKRGRGPKPGTVVRLLGELRFDAVRLSGSLCLGDAAATALGCGALNALAGCLPARHRLARVRPDFGTTVHVRLRGAARLRAGQLALAAARTGLQSVKGRIEPWISTRLKAS